MTQEDLKTIKKLIDEGVENKLREYGIIKENKNEENTCDHASEKHVYSYKKEWMQDNWYGD